ncbi:unnamed protein product [Acanthoscelides obtectus]|uniref:Uncharacterized protein n=1 Tax=Acanthoscelides obtectus TaxID=200917 RepID=A0A9P0K8P3_ACAOB|nr:unnamed protein product [Acanthoscelides obtectus]CAK1643006.1 hypothetical protein AOBTE_LOCUS13358 [Acanthoscelides obtectus]
MSLVRCLAVLHDQQKHYLIFYIQFLPLETAQINNHLPLIPNISHFLKNNFLSIVSTALCRSTETHTITLPSSTYFFYFVHTSWHVVLQE